jgi:dTDP-4-dehydrorhamnose 3,5-epimerase
LPVVLIKARRFEDERGWFTETYNQRGFTDLGVDVTFCQDNHSLSRPTGVLRGLHYQTPPHAQAKLVRCIRGSIWDVAVDIRKGSPTYAQWTAATLSAENGHQLFVPAGFAHGFVTLEPDTEVTYKVSDFYAPECDGGIAWDDPDIGLPWPVPPSGPLLSAKDGQMPKLADFDSPFAYDGCPLTPVSA